jgi:nuclear pore complex protein Nup205
MRVPIHRQLTKADIDNPDALRKYYGLLDSILRVIVTAVFSRGLHNEQMIEQTRSFLTENRQSMVGIFKRFAKIGGAAAPEHHEALTSIAKSYTALVAATDFLEVSVSTLVIMVPNANICVI